MNEDMEARAHELDPTKSRTIGSYVIGTYRVKQERLSGRAPSARSNQPFTSPREKK